MKLKISVVQMAVAAADPEENPEHWKILVRARAIENQMFVVGPQPGGE